MSENKTAYAILGLLHHEPLSGYDIRKRIEGSLGYFWDAGFGQIYPTLKKLASEGLVTSRTEKGGVRPDRKVYAITEEGRQELRKWLEQPSAREYVRYEILLKLFFGSLVEPERNLATIREFRQRYAGSLKTLEEYARQLRRVLPESPDHLYHLLTVLFGLRVYRAYLDWADEASELLHRLEGGVLHEASTR
ncbi:MAG: PadR family transcriptional regulator [Betaproteobacteria bacterium]